jgi:hypothetical protein
MREYELEDASVEELTELICYAKILKEQRVTESNATEKLDNSDDE